MGKEVQKNNKEENSTEQVVSNLSEDKQKMSSFSQKTPFKNNSQEEHLKNHSPNPKEQSENISPNPKEQSENISQDRDTKAKKIFNKESALDSKIEKVIAEKELSLQLTNMRELVQDSKDKYIRLAADFDNYKKRQLQQSIFKEKYANEAIAKDLFTVVDSLEIALEHITEKKDSENFENFIKGIQLVHQQMMDAFKKHHIVKMNVLGESFDPSKHEAVSTAESDELEENKILAVFKSGYSLYDRIIRPAVVQVSKSKGS